MLIEDFDSLFLAQTPLIDTRAPIEFLQGSVPGAINLPLMTDEERAAVGTCYKQEGQDAAVALGHRLVSGETKAARVAAWVAFSKAQPQGALFCFRGGMRSAISQQWLADAGIHYPRVAGGYKAMRRWLINRLEHICATEPFVVLGGRTGSAKTRLLNESINGSPIPTSIDLEGLANHRGSSFGRRATGQPSQIDFENHVTVALLRSLNAHPNKPVIAEDESRLIGRCALPLPLQETLKRAPLVLLETTLEERVEHSFENYILANLTDFAEKIKDPDEAFEVFAGGLLDSLDRIRKRLGGERHRQLREVMEAAIVTHRNGDSTQHRAWIEPLLRDYYDPMYDYQLKDRLDRVVFRGPTAEVREFLITYDV